MRWCWLMFLAVLMASCSGGGNLPLPESSCRYARFFDVLETDSSVAVVMISPDGRKRDTVRVDEPLENIICMSSSHVAALSQIGADSLISAVSGIGYISSPVLRDRYDRTEGVHRGCKKNPSHAVGAGPSPCGQGGSTLFTPPMHPLYDIGYESGLDYERILELKPDMLMAYTVSMAEPPYIAKLRSMGIPVMIIHDHLENHPLARAEYVRLFGALTHRLHEADSVFTAVCDRYESLAADVAESGSRPRKVLINTPYADAWYIPGEDSYMSRLIRDAGGLVLGSQPGTSVSGVVSLEKAYQLSLQADLWLDPGNYRTRSELRDAHQLFPRFGPLAEDLPIYNNTLRTTPEGGNDFWESGAMRPDLILQDLIAILQGDSSHDMNYFISIE